MTRVEFAVRGIPVPQGALVRSPSGGLYHRDGKRLDVWRGAIGGSAGGAMGDEPLADGPMSVVVDFILPRPQHHYLPANRKRPVRELRADAPVYAAGAPDADKLLRAVLDALTGVVYRDDGQVASVSVRKFYEADGRPPGARGVVRSLPVTE